MSNNNRQEISFKSLSGKERSENAYSIPQVELIDFAVNTDIASIVIKDGR